MGGIAGRVDALFGAVEAQKTTGGLHFHFFMFVQRVHQSNTIKDIAKKIEENLINAEELKHFLGQICCETYPDLQQFAETFPHFWYLFPTLTTLGFVAWTLLLLKVRVHRRTKKLREIAFGGSSDQAEVPSAAEDTDQETPPTPCPRHSAPDEKWL